MQPDRNPLRRRTDRVEALIFGGLVVAAAAGAPLAAITASGWAHAGATRAAHVQQETRHQVQAVLLAPPGAVISGYTVTGRTPAAAAWTAPSGVQRTGQISVPADSTQGTAITVWTDQAGNVISPPLTPAQIADQSTFAALITAAAILLALLLTAVATRLLANRRRMAAWTADWVVTAPMWNRQRW